MVAPGVPLALEAFGLLLGGAHVQREHWLGERDGVGERVRRGEIEHRDQPTSETVASRMARQDGSSVCSEYVDADGVDLEMATAVAATDSAAVGHCRCQGVTRAFSGLKQPG
jgi:hypothetical protein